VTLLVPWIGFPLALGVVALGSALLLERAAGRRIPGPLLLPAGLAVVTVVASFTTVSYRTAELTVPVLVGLAVLGLGLGRRSLRRFDAFAAGCALVAYLVVAAPVLGSGEPTFTGYAKLDDTATFLALTDRVLEHGRDLDGLAPSSYEATLAVNLAQGYPTGALLPLGVGARLVGTDPAWVFQPYLAFLAAMLALSLYALTGSVLRSPAWRGFAAALASQPALLYGFALWGGVKELYAAAALALVGATVPLARGKPRTALVPGVAAAATILALSPGAAVWLLPPLVGLLTVTRTKVRLAAVGCAVAVAFALPAFLTAARFLRDDNRSSFRDDGELGNLLRPLDPAQLLGVWPTGDFRVDPSEMGTTIVVLAVALVACGIGLFFALQERASALLIYTASSALGAVALSVLGSPWLEAKAFAIASPAILLLALVGGTTLLERKRTAAVLVLATLAGGVFASNALAYRDASLAPRAQLVELEKIGHRFAGAGPALMTEYQPYGVRHFLRRLDAEGASELRRRPVPLRDGRFLEKGEVADLDAFAPETLLVYRTLVLRRLPTASRPPAPFTLVWRGRFYDVWQRADAGPTIVGHLPLGTSVAASAPTPCADVARLAEIARRSNGLLAAAGDEATALVYVTPAGASALCGESLDWIEVVVP